MVLSIEIDPETEARLRAQASAAGKDVDAYVAELVQRAAAQSSVDEMLAPLRRQFAESGTSEQELTAQIQAAVDAYRAEKKKTA